MSAFVLLSVAKKHSVPLNILSSVLYLLKTLRCLLKSLPFTERVCVCFLEAESFSVLLFSNAKKILGGSRNLLSFYLAIISLRKRKLVALLKLCSCCCMGVCV